MYLEKQEHLTKGIVENWKRMPREWFQQLPVVHTDHVRFHQPDMAIGIFITMVFNLKVSGENAPSTVTG